MTLPGIVTRTAVVVALLSGLVATMPPCLAYSNPLTLGEDSESADIVVIGKLVEIIHGPATGAVDRSAMGCDARAFPPSSQTTSLAERVVFLRIEIEETLKHHTYGRETILAAYTTYAIDCPVGDDWFVSEDQVGQRFLLFLGFTPVARGKQGHNGFFILNKAHQIVDGKISALVKRDPWSFEEVPLDQAVATVKRATGR